MEKDKNYYRDKIVKIAKYISSISDHFKKVETSEEDEILNGLRKAQQEWKMKEEYFDSVTDPDLIDHAIYELKASKIKYIYFLKRAKEIGNK